MNKLENFKNGTIYSVRYTIKYTDKQTGDMDSERLVLNFIKEVFRGAPHKGKFIPTLEYITAFDAMHI